MSYLLKSSIRNRKNKGVIYAVIFIFLALAIIIQSIFPHFFYNLFGAIGYPLWKGQSSISLTLSEGLDSEETLRIKNSELTDKITELESHTLNYRILEQQNKDLKEILGRVAVPSKGVTAVVLKKPPFSPYDTFIVDAGSLLGVKVADRVFASGNILIGEVLEVAGSHSKIKLYSTPGEQFAVTIATSSVQAVAYGKGGGNFEAIVPREIAVREGDAIVVPHISPIIFGVVEAVDGEPAEAFKRILFKIPVNVFEQNWVFIEYTK